MKIMLEESKEKKLTQPFSYKGKKGEKKIAIIGGGWFGVHAALEFKESGYDVTIYEKNNAIFTGTSGTFGVRIHAGQHYPRSYATRKSCRDPFYEMLKNYPEMCNQHTFSIYAHGKKDVDGNPSKVTENTFYRVCKEFLFKGDLDLETSPFSEKELISAYDIDEPSAVVGKRLRWYFEKKLKEADIKVKCNTCVTKIKKEDKTFFVGNKYGMETFDAVIDASGFQQTFLPFKELPFNMNVFYQPCLALVYKDKSPGEKPISFIVMDGWFPCLMPYDDRENTEKPMAKYIMTHGKWTILGSYKTAKEANEALSVVNEKFVKENIQSVCEKDMQRFWPDFCKRFEYVGFRASVLAKIKTEYEFRGAVVFQEPTLGIISIFPGKITNIFEAGREAGILVDAQISQDKCGLKTTENGYVYVENGVIDNAEKEIKAPVLTNDRNTCSLNTFEDKLKELQENKLNTQNSKKLLSIQDESSKHKSPFTFSPPVSTYKGYCLSGFFENSKNNKKSTITKNPCSNNNYIYEKNGSIYGIRSKL